MAEVSVYTRFQICKAHCNFCGQPMMAKTISLMIELWNRHSTSHHPNRMPGDDGGYLFPTDVQVLEPFTCALGPVEDISDAWHRFLNG